jgi:hypothetical protein
MLRTIEVVEGQEFQLPVAEGQRLRVAMVRTKAALRPSFSIFSERNGSFKIGNVVGTIDIGSDVVLNVTPKVPAGTDWVSAAVSLLTGAEGVDVGGDRRAGVSHLHRNLLDGVASAFLQRLTRAYRQEGPILLFERNERTLVHLQGKLHASRWARFPPWKQHHFPVTKTELARDNPFTCGLLVVAKVLAARCSNQRVRQGLLSLARDLSAGVVRASISPETSTRKLPEQWSAYKGSWSMAQAVLSRTSLFGAQGDRAGLSLAVEAWPLLETHLERTLESVRSAAQARGRTDVSFQMQGETRLLSPIGVSQKALSPKPDGRLIEDGRVLATFEAKYFNYDGQSPEPAHVYQALAAAAVCGAPLAVLVYPDNFAAHGWNVHGFQGAPAKLACIGANLFKHLSPAERATRAHSLLNFIEEMSPAAGAVSA